MPERIEVRRFGYSQEAEYIHKYYLPREFRGGISRQDVEASYVYVPLSWGEEDPSGQVKSMLSNGVILFYKDIGCEKFLAGGQVQLVFDATAAWTADGRAKLTDEEVTAAIALNTRLTRLEDDILAECMRLDNEMQARLHRGDGFASDYEILVDVEFYMDDTHSEYYEDDVYLDTEMMARLEWTLACMPGKGVAGKVQSGDYWGVGDGKDHNHIMSRLHAGHPLWGIPHCRLFHELEDHSPMPMKHVGHISQIWTEIKVWHQKVIDLR